MSEPTGKPKSKDDVSEALKSYAEDIVSQTLGYLAGINVIPRSYAKRLASKAMPDVVAGVLEHAKAITPAADDNSTRNLMIAAAMSNKQNPAGGKKDPRAAPQPDVKRAAAQPPIDIDALIAAEVVKLWGDPALAEANVRLLLRTPKKKMPNWVKLLNRDTRVPKGLENISTRPFFPVSQSVQDDYIVCLIDGERRSMLSRYLKSKYGITPEQYRKHFKLPEDYPMTCGSYRNEKARLAVVQGLGTSPEKHTFKKGHKRSARQR